MDKPGMNPKMGMDMMKKMMGSGDGASPMKMCKDMTSSIKKTASLAAFATPELYALFSEWLQVKENEILDVLKSGGKHDLASIAKTLKLSTESTAYLLARMAAEEKLSFEVKSNTSAKKAVKKKKAKPSVKKATKKKTVKKKAAKKTTKKARK